MIACNLFIPLISFNFSRLILQNKMDIPDNSKSFKTNILFFLYHQTENEFVSCFLMRFLEKLLCRVSFVLEQFLRAFQPE